MIKQLGHISITCTDIAKSVKFYTETLGFKKYFETKLDSMLIILLKNGDLTIELLFSAGNIKILQNAGSIDHFALIVDDIDKYINSIRKTSLPFIVQKNRLVLDKPLYYAFIEGPDKERIELVQFL